MKASKFPIILNSIVLLLYIATASSYFIVDKPVFGFIWLGGAGLWAFTVVLSVKTYRLNRKTAEYYARMGWRS